MGQHIVLTFLSTVRTETPDNGMVEAQETSYSNVSGETTRTTNESALRYLMEKLNGEKIARIFVFASEKVRKEGFVSAELGGKKVTHLEYFRERMRKFIPYMDECMPEEAIYRYEEDATVEESLRSVAKMAKWIQEFKRGFKEDVKLHVDLTGGMRSVNVMMLDVARLLEYSGVSRGHLLYSKYDPAKRSGTVEELGNIYELFQLISGAEEFVRFGSAKVLRDFYKERSKSDQLRRLLDAMEGFAEEIKLCHYGQLKDAIVELHDAVRDFDAEASEDVQELLLGRLVDRIREEYHQLIALRDLDDLRVIRWCLKHGYMQQALTLYTERIPEYIGEHGLIRQTESESKRLEKSVQRDGMGRNKWFYLLNEYESKIDRIDKYINKYFSLIKDNAFPSIRKKKFDMEAWWQEMESFLKKHSMACKDEQQLKAQLALLDDLHRDSGPLLNLSDSALEPIRPILAELERDLSATDDADQRLKRVDYFLLNEVRNESLREMMPMPYFCDDMVRQYPKVVKTHKVILDGIFTPAIEEGAFLSIMDKYVRLKNERNHSNHARNDMGEFPSAEKLQQFMEEGLDEVERAVKACSSVEGEKV